MSATTEDSDLAPLGVIAGTGFYALDELVDAQSVELVTSYGTAHATIGRS